MNKKSIALVVGTRPEAIKLAPVYRAMAASNIVRPILLSTGQHREMLTQTLAAFGLRPDADLALMQANQTLPDLTARVLQAMTRWLAETRPAALLVQGDTTTAFAAALAAIYAGVPVGHVEAGLRTHNLRAPFPEEMNRRLISPLARWNFCPTPQSRENLHRENIDPETCHVTGNTVIDSLLWVREQLRACGASARDVAGRLGITLAFADEFLSDGRSRGSQPPTHESNAKRWVLVTGHRRESFGGGFERICEAINRLTEQFPDLGVLYPVHLNPQVQEPVRRLLGRNPCVALIEPVGYEDFIWLLDRCTFALSDSGGVQEEAPSLGKPVLVMRETTERPEGVAAGTCTLVGTDPDRILAESHRLLTDPTEYARRSALQNPYGDGHAASRIVAILENDLGS